VSFPTGAGKSKLAELKIAVALLRGTKAIFLAPTLALVDQTATALAKTFPQAQIQQERAEEFLFTATELEPLPGISVLTPERCLSMLSFSPQLFADVGLLVLGVANMVAAESYHGNLLAGAAQCSIGKRVGAQRPFVAQRRHNGSRRRGF